MELKLLIASDIHGAAGYCAALLEALDRERADKLILLGDLLYHGPRNDPPEGYAPKETAALLNTRKDRILCVRGNCDAEVDQMMLKFPILSDYALICACGYRMYATHGHVYGPDRLPPLQPGDVLLYGHTHVPAWYDDGEIVCVNPGSVSLPKNGSPRTYLTLEKRAFLWKTLDGELWPRYKVLERQ